MAGFVRDREPANEEAGQPTKLDPQGHLVPVPLSLILIVLEVGGLKMRVRFYFDCKVFCYC